MTYIPKQLAKADSLVGQKCKIYYPWKRKMIHRVVRKDMYGYYVKYQGKKKRLRLAINDFGEMVRFEVIHEGRDNHGQRVQRN